MAAVAPPDAARSGSHLVLSLVAALSLIVLLFLFMITKIDAARIEQDTYNSLTIMAEIKAHAIESWIAERRGDVNVVSADLDLIERVASFRREPDAGKKELLRQRLDSILKSYGYSAAYLLDPQGEELMALGFRKHDMSAQTRTLLSQVFSSGEIAQSDFYFDANDGLPSLNFVAPLQIVREGKRQAVAALVLHTEPATSILLKILPWPTDSPSGETLLVRKEGEAVVYLNQLRHVPDSALKFKQPLANPLLPAAVAIRSNQAGTVRGIDYRGADVMAAYRPIAGTDWHIIAQLDHAEVMAPLWRLIFWIGGLAFIAIAAVGAVLGLFWSQKARLHQLDALASQAESDRKSAAFKLAILNSVSAEIAVIDHDGTIIAVNEPWQRFDLEKGNESESDKPVPHTDVGANYLAVCQTSGDARAALNGIQAVLNGSLPRFSLEYACHSPLQQRWLAMNVLPLELDSKNGAVITHNDITQLKQAEEHASQLLAENQTILNNALVGIIYLRQRRVVSCNRRFEEIFHYAPGEMVGKSSEVIYDTDQNFLVVGARAYATLAEGKNFSDELLLRHKDGSLFWGAMNGCAIDPAHPQEGSIWVFTDISERRRIEHESSKLLQAVEQSPVSIFVTDRKGAIEYVNPSFTRITGYTREEAVGQNPRILKSRFTPRATHEELWRTIREGNIWSGVLCNQKKDGNLVYEEMSVSPIVDAAGEITHFVAVKNDVTERKILEERLERHQSHLEELVAQRTAELSTALEAAKLADRTKDEFLANITHELRTPLSAVIGMAGLARGISSEPRQRDYLDKIAIAGKHLNRIINDLLDLSKIAAGHLTFENRVFSLHDMILRGNSVMSHRAAEKGVELVESIDDAVPDLLRGDPLRIEQILLNLIGNAIKFTTTGRVEVRIGMLERKSGAARLPSSGSLPGSAGAVSEKRICLDIQVEDSGIGMQPEDLEQMFKPFSQADATMSRRFGGTGLGLAICKRLAEMMDGDISVTSQAGIGSTFRVKLWLDLAEAGELPPAEEKERESVQVRYQNTHVLVVDDQPFNRDVVEGLLAVVGITPHLAKNGQEALDMLRDNKQAFDLVLMDIQMPVMDGLTATRAIRGLDRFAQLPIIAMTAHTMAHEREKSVAIGMNDHIGKPFDEASFYRVLAKWIPSGKQRTQLVAVPSAPTTGLPPLRGIDVHAGLALLQGNEARYRQWLNVFVAEMPATMAHLRDAIANGKTEPASMAAHTLKGRTGLLGMNELHVVVAALEAAIEKAEPTSELLLNLEHGVAAMCSEIESKLGPQQSTAKAANPVTDILQPGK
jgi:PAS domain S-box-containing protein